MGVKIKEILLFDKIDLKNLKRKIVAVDGPNIVMSLLRFSYQNKSPYNAKYLLDRTRRPISHLYGLLYRVKYYLTKKILPIFCFDGKVHPYKRQITKDQLSDFLFVKKMYKEAIKNGNMELAQNIATGKEFLWINTIQESKRLLSLMGMPYIEAPTSAESQCAQLTKNEVADYTVSQDFDCLLFGCPFQIQNLSKSGKRKISGKWNYYKINPVIIDLKKNLRNLKLDQFQLIDLAILIGTDYNAGIRNLGAKTSLLLINKYGSLETIMKQTKDKYDFTSLTSKKIEAIRELYLFPKVIENHSKIIWNEPHLEGIMDFLCRDHHLNRERVENNVSKLIWNYKSCIKDFKQKEILSFI